jgi:hypothetical protein
MQSDFALVSEVSLDKMMLYPLQSAMQLSIAEISRLLVQSPTPLPGETNPTLSPIEQTLTVLGLSSLGPTLLNLIGAILIFIAGWILAVILARLTKSVLQRTSIDNRLAQAVSGTSGESIQTESLISKFVFWTVLILAAVAALDVLKLTTVSQPLNNFLNQIFAFLPRLGAAGLLAAIAWVLASIAKTAVSRLARSFNLDQRISSQASTIDAASPSETPPLLLSETLGNVLYWFVFLFFLPLILGVLDLQGPLQPVQNLLNELLAALPRILKAILIGVVGWLIARVVRNIVTNLLAATGADQIGRQFGLSRASSNQSLSWLAGTIVYVLILIPTAVAALEALEIQAISAPAVAMLNQILTALPQIFTAVLILVAAYVVGRFVGDLVTNVLSSVGFDRIFHWLGLQQPTPPSVQPEVDTEPLPPAAPPSLPTRSPSEIGGIVVLVGIMLFATVAATNVLNIPALTAIISELLVVFGRVLVGLFVFGIGLYLANLAFNLILSSGNAQARILAQTARIAIIALVTAMALQQMGIAANIVNLAFGLLLGSIAVALAIAFGLGGRTVAAEQLEEWRSALKRPPHNQG